MKVAAVSGIVLVFLVVWAGVASPAGGAQGAARMEGADRGSGLSERFAEVNFEPACTCRDIAYMDAFRSRKLEHARTPEFAEAVFRVASGASRYSPRDIPADWRLFAAELVRRKAARGGDAPLLDLSVAPPGATVASSGLRLLRDEERLIPALIYLGSLEYRSQPGRGGAAPIFPSIVRSAIRELDGRVDEKRWMAGAFARRAAAIRERIAAAERVAPGNCAPDDVVRAKAELDRACREASGVRSTLKETEAMFARADRVSEGLLGSCAREPAPASRVPATR